MEIRFAWDERKNRANERKHGIRFEEARAVFGDPHARLIGDPDHSEEESRFVLLGLSPRARLLIVVHCFRENDEVIRIISARKATKAERLQYEELL